MQGVCFLHKDFFLFEFVTGALLWNVDQHTRLFSDWKEDVHEKFILAKKKKFEPICAENVCCTP